MEARYLSPSRFVAARFVPLVVLLLLAGCQSAHWPFNVLSTHPDVAVEMVEDSSDDPAEETVAEELGDSVISTDTPDGSSPAPEKLVSTLPANGLSDDRWVITARPMNPGIDEPPTRWRHPVLEKTIAMPVARRPDLTACLENPNPVIAANAAIVIGRWQQAVSISQLQKAAENDNLKLPLRQAAIESLGAISTDESRAAVDQLLGDPTAASDTIRACDIPELHAELLAARSHHVSAMDDSRFLEGLKSKSPQVRLEAARAFALSETALHEATPDRLLDLCGDSDTRVRIAAIWAVARHHHPRAADQLARATKDFDTTVRAAAIAALGVLGTNEARLVLDKLRKDPSEISRAAVVGALAALGADEAVIAAATDRSPRVREAVAESIRTIRSDAKELSKNTEALAHQLVKDVSSEVQRETVDALKTWPLVQAGPVLLEAMERGTMLTRKLAAEQLAERWPPATSFYCDATLERRAEQLAELKTRWEEQFGVLKDQVIAAAATEIIRTTRLTEAQLELLDEWLRRLSDPSLSDDVRRQLLSSLEKLGPELLSALEERSLAELQRLPPQLFSQVLPDIAPVFASLEKLASDDAQLRRAGASELATHLHGKQLSNLALTRLAQIAELQSDPLVWQAIMVAISSDPRQIAVRLAYMAVANASSEVRRRACVYLQDYPSKAHCDVLVPMLDDPNATVVIAAIRAIAAAEAGDSAPLIRLLNSPDKQVRLEAGIALARSDLETGFAAIERLSREADLEIRRSATVAMGELAKPHFTPELIRLLDDRRDIQLAAMRSLAKIAGKDIGQSEGESVLPDEQVRRWKRWHADQGVISHD